MKRHHSIDFVFVLLVFSLFVMGSLALISIGSRVYSSTVDTLEQNYTQYTILDYIQQKVRQNLSVNQIEIQTFDHQTVLCIHEIYQDVPYTTYIYHDQNALKELLIDDKQSFDKDRGETIMEVDAVSFDISQNILTITVENNQEKRQTSLALIGGSS